MVREDSAYRRYPLNRRNFIALACSWLGVPLLGINPVRSGYVQASQGSPAPAVINAWLLIGAQNHLQAVSSSRNTVPANSRQVEKMREQGGTPLAGQLRAQV